jgi:hypothetical protein
MLNARMIGSVTVIGLSGTGASHPKYNTITTAINAHSSSRNLPCVTRYVLQVS